MTSRRAGLLAVIALSAFLLLAALVAAKWAPLMRLDRRVDVDLNGYAAAHRSQTRAWQLLSDVLQPATLRGAVLVVAVALLLRRQVMRAVLCAAVAAGSLLVVTAGKDAVGRPRPRVPHPVAHSPGASFPSGHATTAAAVALALIAVAWPGRSRGGRIALLVGAAGLAALVGFSRMVLGVHYLSDVVGGWLAAVALVLALWAVELRTR